MAEVTTAVVERFYHEVVNGDLDAIDELMAEDFVEHEELPGLPPNRDGVKQFFGMLRSAFEGFRMDLDAVYVAGDTVITRVTMRGTHTGEFMGIPASGKDVAVPLADFIRFDGDGKAAEHWGVVDNLVMLQQLGVVPEESPAG